MNIKELIEMAIEESGKKDSEIAKECGFSHRCGLRNTIMHMGDYSTIRVVGRLLKACGCGIYVKVGGRYHAVDFTHGCKGHRLPKMDKADKLLERLSHDRE